MDWDRKPEEKDSAWAAFSSYRDAGLHRTFQSSGLPLADTLKLAKEHAWVSRVRAWDAHVEQACQEARQAALVATAARLAQDQAEAAAMAISVAANSLRAELAAQREGDGTAKTVDLRTAVRLLDTGIKLNLLLQGKPTDTLKISLEDLTPEELAALLGK